MARVRSLRRYLSPEQKAVIKRLLYVSLSLVPAQSNLELLALKYGTDKFGHGYMNYYESFFSDIRKRKMNVLEIGVGGYHNGGYDNPRLGGESLRMWQEYFPNSMIYAIDICDKSELQDKRIKVFQGSQNDPTFLREVSQDIGGYDIIIDDGSHVSEHILTSLNSLFPFLKDGGFYVIEDLQTAYDPSYGGDADDLNNPNCAMAALKSYADGLNYQYIRNWSANPIAENIASIHFFPQIVFMKKGRNERQIFD